MGKGRVGVGAQRRPPALPLSLGHFSCSLWIASSHGLPSAVRAALALPGAIAFRGICRQLPMDPTFVAEYLPWSLSLGGRWWPLSHGLPGTASEGRLLQQPLTLRLLSPHICRSWPPLATGHTHPHFRARVVAPTQGSKHPHRMERQWPPGLPSPQEQRTGAQALPGIGHGPPWPSRVTGKCPSSAGLQAAQTMLGCPGLLPPRSKRGWETAPRDPFIPGAGLAYTALALCRLPGS